MAVRGARAQSRGRHRHPGPATGSDLDGELRRPSTAGRARMGGRENLQIDIAGRRPAASVFPSRRGVGPAQGGSHCDRGRRGAARQLRRPSPSCSRPPRSRSAAAWSRPGASGRQRDRSGDAGVRARGQTDRVLRELLPALRPWRSSAMSTIPPPCRNRRGSRGRPCPRSRARPVSKCGVPKISRGRSLCGQGACWARYVCTGPLVNGPPGSHRRRWRSERGYRPTTRR